MYMIPTGTGWCSKWCLWNKLREQGRFIWSWPSSLGPQAWSGQVHSRLEVW